MESGLGPESHGKLRKWFPHFDPCTCSSQMLFSLFLMYKNVSCHTQLSATLTVFLDLQLVAKTS